MFKHTPLLNVKRSVYKRIKNFSYKIHYLIALNQNHPNYLANKDYFRRLLNRIDQLSRCAKKLENFEQKIRKKIRSVQKNLDGENGKDFFLAYVESKIDLNKAIDDIESYLSQLGRLQGIFGCNKLKKPKKNEEPKAHWFNALIAEEDKVLNIRTLLSLIPIRNKTVSHDQDDIPSNSDYPLGINKFGLKPSLVGSNHDPYEVKLQCQFFTKQRHYLLKKYKVEEVPGVEYCIREGEDDPHVINFNPIEAHARIQNEILTLLEKVFS